PVLQVLQRGPAPERSVSLAPRRRSSRGARPEECEIEDRLQESSPPPGHARRPPGTRAGATLQPHSVRVQTARQAAAEDFSPPGVRGRHICSAPRRFEPSLTPSHSRLPARHRRRPPVSSRERSAAGRTDSGSSLPADGAAVLIFPPTGPPFPPA